MNNYDSDSKDNEGNTSSFGSHLDSHANMIVVGSDCHIISKSTHSAVVNAFTKDVGTIEVPIIDALLVYEDPT